jgi:histone-lysine N-methyltransferase SETMAR
MSDFDPDYSPSHPLPSDTSKIYATRLASIPEAKKDEKVYVTLTKLDFYNFKVLAHYNFSRRLSPEECHEEFGLIYGTLIPTLNTVRTWYKDLELGKEIREMNLKGGKPELKGLEVKIQQIIDDNPYISLRRMELMLGHSKKALKKIVQEKLGLEKVSTRWVPHILTPDQMHDLVETAELMKKKLLQIQKEGYINLVTGDESWFYLSYPPSSKWTSSSSSREVVQSPDHYAKKVMITICFSADGLRLIHLLPPHTTMNATIFVDFILKPVETLFSRYPFAPETKLFIHYDNARAHVCKHTSDFLSTSSMERLPHPPYSPDISPCDFFLFGYLKHLLAGLGFDNPLQLEHHLKITMNEISQSTYTKVFNHWIDRLDFVIESEGKYFNKKYDVCFFQLL